MKSTNPAVLDGKNHSKKRPVSERKYSLDFTNEVSKTQQNQKNECDVNTIMENYSRTGVLKGSASTTPNFGQQTSTELKDALQIVINAETQFNALPAKVRAKFKNDPSQLLDFVNDSKNVDEMVELGLATKPKAPTAAAAPAAVAAVPAPPAPPIPPVPDSKKPV